MYRGALAAFVVLVVAGCAPDFRLELVARNAVPYASAGTGGTYRVGTTVSLDATGSFDPDGEIRRYTWGIESRPPTSTAEPADMTSPVTSLTLDAAGTYVFSVTVADDQAATSISRLKITSEGPRLVVNAGLDAAVEWNTQLPLIGSVEIEPGFAITGVEWKIISSPGTGATLTGASTLTPTFETAEEGTYVLRLTAHTPYNSVSDDVTVECTIPRQALPRGLVDAEYSKALNEFVIVSSGPAALLLQDPATGTGTSISLPYAPTSVSVSPDGLRAAVGHSGYVTTVNLQTAAVITTYTMTIDVRETVYGADNRIHCFEFGGFGWGLIHTINVTNGNITNNQVYADGYASARLHPGGLAMYSTRSGSPDNIEKFNVSASPVTSVGASPYHGEHRFGGGLWFTEDGNYIIARSRNVFYSSTNTSVGMTYRTALDGIGEINGAVHSAAAGRVATVASDGVHLYEDQQLASLTRIDLPVTPSGNTWYSSEGRYVAYRSDGSSLYVITRADTGAGYLFVLYVLSP